MVLTIEVDVNAILSAQTAAASTPETIFTEAIDTLAQPFRDVLRLHDIGGLNARAIGAALGLGTAQVQVALLHARRAVRGQLVNPDCLQPVAVQS